MAKGELVRVRILYVVAAAAVGSLYICVIYRSESPSLYKKHGACMSTQKSTFFYCQTQTREVGDYTDSYSLHTSFLAIEYNR